MNKAYAGKKGNPEEKTAFSAAGGGGRFLTRFKARQITEGNMNQKTAAEQCKA